MFFSAIMDSIPRFLFRVWEYVSLVKETLKISFSRWAVLNPCESALFWFSVVIYITVYRGISNSFWPPLSHSVQCPFASQAYPEGNAKTLSEVPFASIPEQSVTFCSKRSVWTCSAVLVRLWWVVGMWEEQMAESCCSLPWVRMRGGVKPRVTADRDCPSFFSV